MKYLIILLFILSVSCMDEKQQSEMILRHYIEKNVGMIRNFTKESTVALWNVNISGNESDYKKLIDLEMDFNNSNRNSGNRFSPDKFTTFTENVFTNEKDFQLLRKLKNSDLITDTVLKRQLTVLYQSFMGPQVEADRYTKLRFAESKLWQSFSSVAIINGDRKYKGTQLDSLRKNTRDTVLLRKINQAYQDKGKQIAGDIIEMVKMRNEFARDFGYSNYYQLALETKDQTPEKIKSLLDDIEMKTRDQFFEAKTMIDKTLAKKFNIPLSGLRYYHYNDERTSFLPRRFSDKMDSLYRENDPVKLSSEFFSGIGLPVQDVIDRSDLVYRKGKSAGTNIYNVDFKNDLRLMATITNSHDGMRKMMHLCGHASHFKNIPDSIPYLLKDPNTVIAEGIASYFENMVSDNYWLKTEFDLDSVNARKYRLLCMHYIQVDRLYRLRKLLVKSMFEREVYLDPEQDLEALWYRLNKEYLGILAPDDPNMKDWATNSYFTSFSCNIHNFVLADLFAGQLQHYIDNKILNHNNASSRNNTALGEFFISAIFKYGDLVPWEKLIERATGEPLNPEYFSDYLAGESESMHKNVK